MERPVLDGRNRVTLADVAAAAGVSKMTASRALRGAGDVSQSNVEKVTKAARAIGYVGNHLASSLSGQRSDLIGVVVPSTSNIVFAEVLSGIAEGIEGGVWQPVFGVTDYDLEKEYEIVRSMLSWNPAGLIVTGLDQSEDTKRLLKNADIPVVQIMDLDGTPVDACVGFSHAVAGQTMAQTLIAKGCKRIGYVGCRLDKDTRARKRLEGFKQALAEHGVELLIEQIGDTPSTTTVGRELTALAMSKHPDLDCVYYSNDDLAAGGAFHCLAHGIDVPDQVMLAGFNGLDIIESLPLQILTTPTPRKEIGKTAASYILNTYSSGDVARDKVIRFTPAILSEPDT